MNFWCWMPGADSKPHARFIGKNDGGTVIIDLDHLNKRDQAKTAWEALKREIIGKGRVLTNCVIVSPERLSRTLLGRLSPHMASQGTCCLFLRSQNCAVNTIPGRKKWKVLNFVPSDQSIGLHGKSIYFEWQKGTQRGAILYVGSANFTIHGYDAGLNHESGVLITGAGNTVRGMQDAALSLLGRIHPVAQAGDSWATERFNGRWKRIEPPQEDTWEEERPYLSQDDQDKALFLMGLKTIGHNQLSFPPKYGSRRIVEAELKGYGGYPQIWMASTRARRRFTHVFWSPPLSLKLTLRHGRTVEVNVPPLEGLMNDGKRDSELLELLFDEPEPLEGRFSNKGSGTLMDSAASVYAGQRVLFPWRAILSSKQGGAHLRSKSKLDRAIRSITSHLQLSFGNTEEGQLLQRKMMILQSTLTKLRQSI